MCSRCTGYRPILDAFKVFAKAEPSAYTAEAIAAARGMAAALTADNGTANGAAKGGKVCPSSGLPCDCGGGIEKPAAANGANGAANGTAAACGAAAAGGKCCGGAANGKCCGSGCAAKAGAVAETAPSSEPIFPKELKNRKSAALRLAGGFDWLVRDRACFLQPGLTVCRMADQDYLEMQVKGG